MINCVPWGVRFLAMGICLLTPLSAFSSDQSCPHVKAIALPAGASEYFPVLMGPPDSVAMESGLVTLLPGKSAGAHGTKSYEELLVPLAGAGELRRAGERPLPMHPGVVVYVPPNTKNDVANTGSEPFRYLFIAAKGH